MGRALFLAGQDSWHPLVSQGNAIYERDVYSCTCAYVNCVSGICPPRSLCPKGYLSSPLLQGGHCEHGYCFPGMLSLVWAERLSSGSQIWSTSGRVTGGIPVVSKLLKVLEIDLDETGTSLSSP